MTHFFRRFNTSRESLLMLDNGGKAAVTYESSYLTKLG